MSEPFKFTDQQRADLSQDLETWEKQSMEFDWLVKAIEDNINYGIESIISARYEADQEGQFWQKCPKCDGQGIVSKPPWIAGDVYEWSSTASQHQCNVCNGLMIIPSPPKSEQK